MNESFAKAIRQYYSIVESAYSDFCDFIKVKYSVDIKNKSELYDFLRNNQQSIFDINEKIYHFHGVGCSVSANGKQIIAWDFGYRSWLCGIEPYKMAITLSNFSSDLEEIFDAERISELCKVEAENGNMTEHDGQYYINLLSLETENYSFPKEYENLMFSRALKALHVAFPLINLAWICILYSGRLFDVQTLHQPVKLRPCERFHLRCFAWPAEPPRL